MNVENVADGYRNRLDENCKFVEEKTEFKGRTSRNYAFVMNMVGLLMDEFPEEFENLGMNWTTFLQYEMFSINSNCCQNLSKCDIVAYI